VVDLHHWGSTAGYRKLSHANSNRVSSGGARFESCYNFVFFLYKLTMPVQITPALWSLRADIPRAGIVHNRSNVHPKRDLGLEISNVSASLDGSDRQRFPVLPDLNPQVPIRQKQVKNPPSAEQNRPHKHPPASNNARPPAHLPTPTPVPCQHKPARPLPPQESPLDNNINRVCLFGHPDNLLLNIPESKKRRV